ncbi:MAG: hypothetical protein FWC41_00185 [Firmicutes bacterium]|nr:hypothetical protein [Bacillota bacterium]
MNRLRKKKKGWIDGRIEVAMNKWEERFEDDAFETICCTYNSDEYSLYEKKCIWFCETILNFAAYDDDISLKWGKIIIEVMKVIYRRQNFEYIKDKSNYEKYLMVANILNKLGIIEWGTSIRGAWFDIGKMEPHYALGNQPLFNDEDELEQFLFEFMAENETEVKEYQLNKSKKKPEQEIEFATIVSIPDSMIEDAKSNSDYNIWEEYVKEFQSMINSAIIEARKNDPEEKFIRLDLRDLKL